MMTNNEFDSYILTNAVLENDYALLCAPYEYIFFKLPLNRGKSGDNFDGIELCLDIQSEKAAVVLNEYLGNKPVIVSGRSVTLAVDARYCETGENILAYKGQLRILEIKLIAGFGPVGGTPSGVSPEAEQRPSAAGMHDPVRAAAQFLLNSQISSPRQSPFYGSCYAIYDYTNHCHRMSSWLWSDAPAVSAMIALAEQCSDPELRLKYEGLALGIGEVFLRTQITDPEDEIYGALVSRFRYYGKANRSFHKLCGMNDTSFSVKWALLPLYRYTGEQKYLRASRIALDWVEKNLRVMEFVPSHYYHEDKEWENRAFVDTGFCAEGFDAYNAIEEHERYKDGGCFLTDRFLSQFRLKSGFFGQNFIPGKGVDQRLFTRGQAWVLEGLLACFRMTGRPEYLEEAKALARLLAGVQKEDGGWSYLLGYGEPKEAELNGSGICEKATAVLAWLYLELYRLTGETRFRSSWEKALKWCEINMAAEYGDGYGGIRARSLASGITGLPFLMTATGYANAFYILAKLKGGG